MSSAFGVHPDLVGQAYGGLLIAGGLLGLLRGGSLISLLAGGSAGLLQIWGSERLQTNPRGVEPLMVLHALMMLGMGYRFAMSEKFMPGGLIMVLSLLSICRYALIIAV